MDIMNSKKTLLSLINGGALLGASSGQQVSFKFAGTIAKAITAAASSADGSLIFAIDEATGAGAIWQDNHLVSSKVIDYSIADSATKDHGQKTVTLKYIGAAGVESKTFDLIDETGLKAYFTGSKTIALDSSIYEVKVKTDGGVKIDENGAGLYVDIADLFGVDGKTIDLDDQDKLKTIVKLAYNANGIGGKPAIQLQTVDSSALSEVEVEDIIGSGIVKSTSYDPATNILTITWKGDPEVTTEIDLSALLDVLSDVAIDSGSVDYLTAVADASTIKFGVTQKVKTGIALAETALQGISEGGSVENYVALDVAAGTDPSTKVITINDSQLNTKIGEIDGSIGDISTRLANKTAEIDSSIDRLDVSVTGIETAIAAMDADLSANALDGSIGITLVETNGKVTTIGVTATEADTTFDAEHITLTSTSGLLTGAAIQDIVSYVNAKSGALDSSVTDTDDGGFVTVKVEQENGALKSDTVTVVYGDYANPQTDGIAKTSTTKAFVDVEIQALDLANDVADASAVDATKGYVKTIISETDGIVKNEAVNVTYGNYTNHTNGIATVEDTSAFVQAALTWTILP